MRRLRMILSAGVLGYGGFTSLTLLTRAVLGDGPQPTPMLTPMIHMLMLGALLVLPLALAWCRPRRGALLLTPPALLFIALYGSQFVPGRLQPATEGAQTLRVMTYNLRWRSAGYDLSAGVIRSADPDIVALQEFSLEAADALVPALSDRYPYQALDPRENGFTGTAVFSRYPLSEQEYIPTLLGSQRVRVQVDGVPLVFYNIHAAIPFGMGSVLTMDNSIRSGEASALLVRLATEHEPVIVAGDFNMTDLSGDYARITAVMNDSYRAAGWGMGWTHAGPLSRIPVLAEMRMLRIDYIFTGRGLRPLSAQVWPDSGGSDHLPVLATVEILAS